MDLAQLSARLKRHLRPGVPKYVSLKDAFVEAIATGSLQSGDKIPNEQQLAATLPMSLGTIQRAMRELADTGVIDRRPGHGSFVKGLEKGRMAHPFHCRFISDDGQSYLPVYPEVLGRNLRPSAGQWQKDLPSANAVEITRRIRIADEFYVYIDFYVDADRAPVFSTIELQDLAHSNFKDIIFQACGQAVTTTDLMMKQEIPPAGICKKLEVAAGTVCTGIRATGRLPGADPVYYQHIYIPPSERELHIVADSRAPGFGM
ncbi:GntR family transcriptional regulator [Bordetella sp. BOR01]|uniref:GntR family transcriptional regulator n=1 Tax=Bordetella sp. BOR01 TaxID=2854779 RepID=UPI001C48748E|nr:GntR family transcriptional regulator [Bordetella sp. BOR01]MBV7483784.1 GntR family transcriptional regulator [Bordetella sp. BOR01]